MRDQQHTRTYYERQLRELKDRLLIMSSQAESMISDSIRSFVDRRPTLAAEVIERDDEMDHRPEGGAEGIDRHGHRVLADITFGFDEALAAAADRVGSEHPAFSRHDTVADHAAKDITSSG